MGYVSSSKGFFFPPNLQHKASTYSTHVTSMSLQVFGVILMPVNCQAIQNNTKLTSTCQIQIGVLPLSSLGCWQKQDAGEYECSGKNLPRLLSFQRIIQSSYVLGPDFWQHLAKSKDVSSDTNLLQVKQEPSSITIVNDGGGSWENRRRNYTFKAC